MKKLALALFVFCSFSVSAQYGNPYRIAFDGTNYYITNKGNGTISKLDASFNHSTIVTGLYSPNDIFFGAVGSNSAIIVIDSNEVKLLNPTTLASLLDVPITGAVEAHDGVPNPTNSNLVYISDRAGNKIIKATIGSAPFYPITFTTLTSNVVRPAGMIFNNSGKLIVVSDTTDGKIYEVNVSTGAVTTKVTTSLDYLNDIAQDNEGNYYVSNWGDDKVYRFDGNFANPYATATYNNPSGLFSNLTNDYLGIACHDCNKVEFKFYHLFSPLADVSVCEGDSFYADFTPTYSGIGTYNAGNKFLVEMSDSTGSFSNGVVLDSAVTQDVPSSIIAQVPHGDYASSGYKYRIRSTSPEVISYFDKNLTINSAPEAFIVQNDSQVVCKGNQLTLGKAADLNIEYTWSPSGVLSDTTVSNPVFSGSTVGNFDIVLTSRDTVLGCSNSDMKTLVVSPELSLAGLQDSVSVCNGDTIEVGLASLPYQFMWDATTNLSDITAGNPRFWGTDSKTLRVNYSDSSNTCSGSDSVYVTVHPKPVGITFDDSKYCYGDTIWLVDFGAANMKFEFGILPGALSEVVKNEDSLVYIADEAGVYDVWVTGTDNNTGCFSKVNANLTVIGEIDQPKITYAEGKFTVSKSSGGPYPNAQGYYWYFTNSSNQTSLIISNNDWIKKDTLPSAIGSLEVATLDYTGDVYCTSDLSDPFELKAGSVNELDASITVYPNPSNGRITVKSEEVIESIHVIGLEGRLITQIEANKTKEIQIELDQKGMQILEVVTSSGILRQVVLVE
jgi:hypothetical protein